MNPFKRLPEFDKEVKKLGKKFPSLLDDLNTLEQVIRQEPLGIGKNFVVVHRGENVAVVKTRLACRSLRGDRSLRVIYAYHETTISFMYIELYHKGERGNEDRARYQNYISKLSSST